jgi:hypothetical protein
MAAIMFVLVATLSFSQQSNTQSNFDFLEHKVKQFLDHEQDFIDYARSHKSNTMEFEMCSDLNTVASRAGDLLDATRALLLVYDNISCAVDRATIRPVIKMQLDHYIKRLNLSVSQVNNVLSLTKNPGIATAASRMKEDLRETRVLLETINLR